MVGCCGGKFGRVVDEGSTCVFTLLVSFSFQKSFFINAITFYCCTSSRSAPPHVSWCVPKAIRSHNLPFILKRRPSGLRSLPEPLRRAAPRSVLQHCTVAATPSLSPFLTPTLHRVGKNLRSQDRKGAIGGATHGINQLLAAGELSEGEDAAR